MTSGVAGEQKRETRGEVRGAEIWVGPESKAGLVLGGWNFDGSEGSRVKTHNACRLAAYGTPNVTPEISTALGPRTWRFVEPRRKCSTIS